MKILIRVIQVIVAILFIISGLVKANDPLGLSYKMQEFFEVWNISLTGGHFFARGLLISLFEFLHEHSLFLSLGMITLEIVTGIALLMGWHKKLVLNTLLVLIIFFTFLTGYAFLSKNPDGSPRFTNCGCFGDCLPIPPLASFMKDLSLLVLIGFLLGGKRYLLSLGTYRTKTAIVIASLVGSIFLQWYVLNYLPLTDCLPFKKGNNIAEQMKPPPGSVTDSTASRFIYEKEGKRYEWAPEQLPADYETYKFVDRIDKLVRKGNAEPRIKGFSLVGEGMDSTQIVLSQPRAVLMFALDTQDKGWVNSFKNLAAHTTSKQIPLYVATSIPAAFKALFQQQGIDVQVFPCDFTVIRTAARTSPTVYFLKSGTIVQKYSKNAIDRAAGDVGKF